MSTQPKGVGSEFFGDPFGAGGPLHVVRARAVRGQVVRVVFDEEPLHQSASGLQDALNPNNYAFSVVSGAATSPQPMGVDATQVVGPTAAVQAGDERAFDVHTDRALVVGIQYQVQARNIVSSSGGGLGAPYSATFMGVVRVHVTRPPLRKVDLTDLKNSPFDGIYAIAPNGDLDVHGGVECLRKRIIRRISTPKGAFAFLPEYGIGLRLKELANVATLIGLKADILAQVKLEPDVADADCSVKMDARGILTVAVRARARVGFLVDASLSVDSSGSVVLP